MSIPWWRACPLPDWGLLGLAGAMGSPLTPFHLVNVVTSRAHTTTLVRGAAVGWVVGRREVACSAVSGKFLVKPCMLVYYTSQRHRSAAWAASDWQLGHCLCHLLGTAEELGEAAQAPE